MIEKCGEKPSTAPKALCNIQEQSDEFAEETEATVAGTKRKADDDMKFNENGNWTLETAKNRLMKLYQAKGLDVNVPLQCVEVGFPPNKAR